MKRTRLLFVGALAALGAIGFGAVSAGGQGPPSGPPADFTVTTTMRESAGRFIDQPPRGRESPGDMFLGSGTSAGAKQGSFQFTCTAITRRVALCQGAGSFADGVIHVQARVSGEGRTVVAAITGGTGAYAGARGTFTSRTTRSTRRVEITQDTYDFVS